MDSSSTIGKQLTISTQLAESKFGDETILLHLARGTYLGLNPLATRVWQAIKEGHPLEQLCIDVALESARSVHRVSCDIEAFLRDLIENELVSVA